MKGFTRCSLAILALSFASPALAFNQTMTCIDAGDRDPLAPTSTPTCNGNEVPKPFEWPRFPITYRINQAGSQEDFPSQDGTIDPQLRLSIVESFEAWNQPDCSPFEFVEGELTEIDAFDATDGVNLVVFQDEDWPYSSRSIALSSVSVRPDGEIVDVDMELNGESFTFTDQEEGVEGAYDVRNTVTHEAGHVLGLDHSPVFDATMQFNADAGQIKKRDLHPDDIAGLCEIYGFDRVREVEPGVWEVNERNPTDPDERSDDNGCCAQVGAGQTSIPGMLVIALLALVFRRRR